MRALLVAMLVVAPLAGCIVDPPTTPLDPASLAPQEAPGPDGAEKTSTKDARDNATDAPPPPPPPASPPPAAPVPPAPPAPPAPSYIVERRFGNVTAGAGAASDDGSVCCVGQAVGDSVQLFTPAAGTTALVFELRWTWPADQAGFDLDLVAKAPDYRDAEPSAPGVPPDVPSEAPDAALYSGHRFTATGMEPGRYVRLVVEDAEVLAMAGDWTIEITPKGPGASVPFELALTSVQRMPPAADYSAFG